MAEQKTTRNRRETSTLPENEPGMQHPEEWRRDLNPESLAGQNIGQPAANLGQDVRTALEVPEVQDRLPEFSNDELRRIPVLAAGSRLQQGATYVDLCDPERRQFTASGEWEVTSDHWYIPKGDTHYQLWNRLIGVENPARRGEG